MKVVRTMRKAVNTKGGYEDGINCCDTPTTSSLWNHGILGGMVYIGCQIGTPSNNELQLINCPYKIAHTYVHGGIFLIAY